MSGSNDRKVLIVGASFAGLSSAYWMMFNVPGKAVMLNAYKNKTDVVFGFVSKNEIAYDRRDEKLQRKIISRSIRARRMADRGALGRS